VGLDGVVAICGRLIMLVIGCEFMVLRVVLDLGQSTLGVGWLFGFFFSRCGLILRLRAILIILMAISLIILR